ncbi:unnamed protein product [Cylindrotheca closterium]|uniref:Cathepsin propeptide inhibitor domain-containing protein n=1 Tax=Cylindrotheca closterium TaxID=2856 RepID=A0AAD2FSN9_9STRA|nr:unnamed protein product [Cylindrotheca closterium]
MRVSLAVLAASLASNQHNAILVSAFQPPTDLNHQHPPNTEQQQQDPNHPRQSTRLNDASAMPYDASAVPYLSNWKLLPEGNIQGVIFGHPVLENGDVVTTSQIKDLKNPSENQIIQTESGSHYLLRDRDVDETRNNFNHKVAGPLLGGAVFAAGAVGLVMDGESARFDTAAPAQAFKEMSAVSIKQFQNSAQSVEESIDLPYLASKVSEAEKQFQAARENMFQNSAQSLGESINLPYLASQVTEAEKQFQAARENMFKQKGPESNAAAASVVAKQQDTQKFEQALSVAAEKVAVEKAALTEKVAWEKFVQNEIAKEKADTEVISSASSAAAKALSENKFDEAKAAFEKAQMARADLKELQAERESATLAEENAEAEEMFAEQDVMKIIREIRQMATMYTAKAASLKPADALYYLEELKINPKLAEYMSTEERQVALGALAAAAATGTALAGSSFASGKKEDEKEVTSTSPMESSTTTKKMTTPPKQATSASPVASSSTKKKAPEPARAQSAPAVVAAKSTATHAASAASSTAASSTAATKSTWGSYLDVLGSYGCGSSVVPSSYSPFGKKSTGMTSHTSLYGPPIAEHASPVAAAPTHTTAAATAATTTTTRSPTAHAPAQEKPRSSGNSGYLDALSGPPGAAVMTSYSPFAPKKSQVSPPTKPDIPEKPDIPAHIRLAYKEWCEYYGKKNEEFRLEVFAQNFADAKEFYKESGRALLLNEYADLTAKEYQLLPKTA